MRLLSIREQEAGQRLDRFLGKYMDKAPKSFFYKMMRKKNITLNGRKAQGNEVLQAGDEIRLFLSDETIDGFSGIPDTLQQSRSSGGRKGDALASSSLPSELRPEVVFENSQFLLFNKPAGLLSQKAAPSDISLIEYLTEYLLSSGQMTGEDLRSFRPGICNRLDRNTSGLVAAGKTVKALQELNELFRTREIRKYYRSIVAGRITEAGRKEGWLIKNEKTNQVTILSREQKGARYICTEYRPLRQFRLFDRSFTYLELHLVTGRSHQIRAQLASLGHPLAGDPKYGNPQLNVSFARMFGLRTQLLHAFRLEFPVFSSEERGKFSCLKELEGQSFTASLPEIFNEILKAGRD